MKADHEEVCPVMAEELDDCVALIAVEKMGHDRCPSRDASSLASAWNLTCSCRSSSEVQAREESTALA